MVGLPYPNFPNVLEAERVRPDTDKAPERKEENEEYVYKEHLFFVFRGEWVSNKECKRTVFVLIPKRFWTSQKPLTRRGVLEFEWGNRKYGVYT